MERNHTVLLLYVYVFILSIIFLKRFLFVYLSLLMHLNRILSMGLSFNLEKILNPLKSCINESGTSVREALIEIVGFWTFLLTDILWYNG